MSPSSAAAVVVSSHDLDATGSFLRHLGFTAGAEGRRWTTPSGAPVAVELRDATATTAAPVAFDRGPRALDLYTSDLSAAAAAAGGAGFEVTAPATIEAGPLTMRQALVTGPGGFPVVLVESSHRRSSLLDDHPDRLLSEPHSVVWCVDDLDAESARWQAAGWEVGPVLSFREPAVSEYLGLPRTPVPIRMAMVAGGDVAPIRLELLEFPDDPGSPGPGGGIEALAFRVDDPERSASLLGVDAAGRTPGGVRVDLRG